MDYRIGIDVMTTETACLSSISGDRRRWRSIWPSTAGPETHESPASPGGRYYDSMIIDLVQGRAMAALPFHPAEAYPIRELLENPGDIFREVEKRAAEQFGGKVACP